MHQAPNSTIEINDTASTEGLGTGIGSWIMETPINHVIFSVKNVHASACSLKVWIREFIASVLSFPPYSCACS